MKFQVTFEDWDATEHAYDAIGDATGWTSGGDWAPFSEAYDFVARWVGDGGKITVEFDTEAGTATVVEREQEGEEE